VSPSRIVEFKKRRPTFSVILLTQSENETDIAAAYRLDSHDHHQIKIYPEPGG
jgi:hypothetical protein